MLGLAWGTVLVGRRGLVLEGEGGEGWEVEFTRLPVNMEAGKERGVRWRRSRYVPL